MSEEEEIIKELEEKYIFNEPFGKNLLEQQHSFKVDGIIYNSTIPNNQLIGITEYQYAKFMQLQDKIDKAIEYIKRESFYDESGKEVMDEPNKLLKILGDNNE